MNSISLFFHALCPAGSNAVVVCCPLSSSPLVVCHLILHTVVVHCCCRLLLLASAVAIVIVYHCCCCRPPLPSSTTAIFCIRSHLPLCVSAVSCCLLLLSVPFVACRPILHAIVGRRCHCPPLPSLSAAAVFCCHSHHHHSAVSTFSHCPLLSFPIAVRCPIMRCPPQLASATFVIRHRCFSS